MRIEQAKSLRAKVAKGSGMSFEAFVTPNLAEWLLEKIENGDFIDPSEAVFHLLIRPLHGGFQNGGYAGFEPATNWLKALKIK